MVFSDTSAEKDGLIQECEQQVFGDNGYGKISGDAGLLATFTRGLNKALRRVAMLIMMASGRWQIDDKNFTTLPRAITNLVVTTGSEQQDYELDVSHLVIERVEVMDQTGAWNKLKPIDQADIYDQSLTDFLKTAGMPTYYDKTGNSIILYPKPLATAVTATGGLKVFFERGPSFFTTTGNDTKSPGFSTLFHPLVAHIASRDYTLSRTMPVAKGISELVAVEEQDLSDHYSLRDRDDKGQLRARLYNFN